MLKEKNVLNLKKQIKEMEMNKPFVGELYDNPDFNNTYYSPNPYYIKAVVWTYKDNKEELVELLEYLYDIENYFCDIDESAHLKAMLSIRKSFLISNIVEDDMKVMFYLEKDLSIYDALPSTDCLKKIDEYIQEYFDGKIDIDLAFGGKDVYIKTDFFNKFFKDAQLSYTECELTIYKQLELNDAVSELLELTGNIYKASPDIVEGGTNNLVYGKVIKSNVMCRESFYDYIFNLKKEW